MWPQSRVFKGRGRPARPTPCSTLPLRPLAALEDETMRLLRTAPARHLDPLLRLEVLVVLEKMLDLLDRDLRKVDVGLHRVVAAGELRGRHCDDLLVAARLVLHEQHADRA